MRTRKALRRKGTKQSFRNQHVRDFLAWKRETPPTVAGPAGESEAAPLSPAGRSTAGPATGGGEVLMTAHNGRSEE